MGVPYTQINSDTPVPSSYQLTVITVCWNALSDLKPTVESVLAQKAKGSISIEHVVVDGASADGTPEWLAEQLAAGNIERYVSEPDRGIYDAMNKGINLARGRVLAFLNAGDTYTDEDLAPCVLPICRGETYGVAACANWVHSPTSISTFCPSYEQLFFGTPCCHQSYFAAAQAYREIGGYDSRNFLSSADADAMYNMFRKWRNPQISSLYVTNFADGGLSSNCQDDFRHENVELLWRNKDQIKQRCQEDEDYKLAMEAFLLNHCYQFRNWQQRHGKLVPDELCKLQTLCRDFAKHAHSLYAKCALRWLARYYLPVLIDGRECSPFLLLLVRFWLHACYVPGENKYKQYSKLSTKPFRDISLLKRFFPRHN